MLKKTKQFVYNLKFTTKLFLAFILLYGVLIGTMYIAYYYSSLDNMGELVSQNAFDVLQKNNKIFDEQFRNIIVASDRINSDPELFDIFSNEENISQYDLLQYDKRINSIIKKYFRNDENIYSILLTTSYYAFGNGQWPFKEAVKTDLYTKALDAKGSIIWIPTYDYVNMLNQNYLEDSSFDYRYMFSCVREMNLFKENNYNIHQLSPKIERPILIVNFKQNFYSSLFNEEIPVKDTVYAVVDKSGNSVFSTDDKYDEYLKNEDFSDKIKKGETGITIADINGNKSILCMDTSTVTGWTSVAIIDENNLMSDIKKNTLIQTAIIIAIFLVIAFLLIYLLSRLISKPLNQLSEAIVQAGEGNFNFRIQVSGKNDIDKICAQFNNMNGKISDLIVENCEVKLHHKEAQIQALNLQLNPHFLYNTLNLINCRAIESGQKDISKLLVALSKMLHYTAHNDEEFGIFSNEVEWLKQYTFIMSSRFKDNLNVSYEIQEDMLSTTVPRLFLQPFLENAFVHGFENRQHDCFVRVKGYIDDTQRRIISVEDNGKGMDESLVEQILSGAPTGRSIGVQNVHMRIKLLYGEEYGVQILSQINHGTKIVVILPPSEQ